MSAASKVSFLLCLPVPHRSGLRSQYKVDERKFPDSKAA